MKSSNFKWLRLGSAVLAMAILLSVGPLAQIRPAKAAGHNVGLVCTNGTSPTPTFNLTTQSGTISLPDGNTMFMWGYSAGAQPFQYPGPVLCVNQDDIVTIILNNTLPKDVSIMFPGQENVLANGVPAQPQFDGSNVLTSLTTAAPANGGSVTYSFKASNPGTFIYESGTDSKLQVNMGLFGALVVRPTKGANFAYNRTDSQFTPTEEFLALLSEIDPYLHQAVQQGNTFDMSQYHPRYWMINGRGFPDSIADNNASWLPSQPYGSLALIHPYDVLAHPQPGLTRYLNVGTVDYPFHPHGNNGLLIGRDGHPLEGPTGQDLSYEKFSFNIGPGQTWDTLVKWYDAEGYSEANPVPVVMPDTNNMTFGMFFGGSPYLGKLGPLPPAATTLNQCGEYYIISHNHALYQLNAWGQTMSGPITYLRIDPPQPNTCP